MTVRGGVLTYTGRLIVEICPDCGTSHAIPEGLREHALRDHGVNVYCPLGHSWHYIGETDAQKERRLRKWAEDQAARERSRADQAEASRRAWKGQTTRLRNRAAAGECIYCGTFFANLGVHVSRKHPDERPRELEEADATALVVDHEKDPAHVATGSIGGKARAARLSPERRSAIASAAAAARWAKR